MEITRESFMFINLFKSISNASVLIIGVFIEFADNLESSSDDFKRMGDCGSN